jgi:hypothetical protein
LDCLIKKNSKFFSKKFPKKKKWWCEWLVYSSPPWLTNHGTQIQKDKLFPVHTSSILYGALVGQVVHFRESILAPRICYIHPSLILDNRSLKSKSTLLCRACHWGVFQALYRICRFVSVEESVKGPPKERQRTSFESWNRFNLNGYRQMHTSCVFWCCCWLI